MARNVAWPVLGAAGALAVVLAGCGSNSALPTGAGTAESINLQVHTVPVIRSVNVSPKKATIGDCHGGSPGNDTVSTYGQLGFPNGRCWFGNLGAHAKFPITITNTGIASQIDVSGTSAAPSDSGNQWNLCNVGSSAEVNCTGTNDDLPGIDQYLVKTFSPDNQPNSAGLTNSWLCDHQFAEAGSCMAGQGAFQTEGLELIGPASTTDQSGNWTVTISWIAAPQ